MLSSGKAKYIAAVAIYGTIGMVLRYISIPSELVVFCRGALGAFFIWLYRRARGKRVEKSAVRRNLPWLLLSGVALGLNWVFLFAAYRRTTVAVASLCNYTAPMIVLFLSPLLYREKLTARKLVCVAASFVGIVLISDVLSGRPEDMNLPGIALGLAAALGFVGILLCNKKLRDISAYDKAIVQLAVSAVTALPYVLLHNRGGSIVWDGRSVWLTLLLCVFHTGVAYCLYFGSLSDIPVQTIAVWGYVEPVVSVLCSALILREAMSPLGWLGSALILGAAVASELSPAKARSAGT